MVVTDQLMKVNESEIKTNLKLHEQGGHKNIVKLFEIIDDDNEEDKLVLVMEYCSQRQMLNWSDEQVKFVPNKKMVDSNGFLPENLIKKAIVDGAAGLDFMHNTGVLHRDVKPQNILISESGEAKIVDFGVSKVLDDPENDAVKTTEGTYHFMAPEACDPDIE